VSLLLLLSVSTVASAKSDFVGNEFEPLSLPRLDGTMAVIKPDQNKLTVINFFASWCAYCVVEMPDFNDYYLQNSDQVAMYLIDMWEKPEAANDFLYKNDYQIPAFVDNTGRELKNRFQIKGVPMTLIIDKKGIIRFQSDGMMSQGRLAAEIEKCREQSTDISINDIIGKSWRFGRMDGSIIANSIQLLPDGKIAGYYHPNESKWAFVNGMVVFYTENGEPSCRFYVVQKRNEKLVMSGKLLTDDSGNTHVLEEL